MMQTRPDTYGKISEAITKGHSESEQSRRQILAFGHRGQRGDRVTDLFSCFRLLLIGSLLIVNTEICEYNTIAGKELGRSHITA
jgi:hypothetical protein